jgi:hypothetical protein
MDKRGQVWTIVDIRGHMDIFVDICVDIFMDIRMDINRVAGLVLWQGRLLDRLIALIR